MMGKRIDAIKQLLQSGPVEVMAGYLLNFVVNSKDHFWKTKYYDQTAYFELNTDNGLYAIDVLYCGQETSFALTVFMRNWPDYKSVWNKVPEILEWLESTYAENRPPEPVQPSRPGRRRSRQGANQRKMTNFAVNMRVQNTPGKTLKRAPSNGRKMLP